MGGTILNVITVAIGSIIGMFLGNRLPERIQQSVITGLGIVTLVVGVSNAQTSGNIIIPLISLALGAILGEILRIDLALDRFAGWLQTRLAGGTSSSEETVGARQASSNSSDTSPQSASSPASILDARQRFITGFVTASLVFCIGPLTFLGSIQDGMGLPIGFQQLAIKSTLDGFAAMAFASSFGLGVLFSILTVFFLQGGLALLGSVAGEFMSAMMITEMTAVGGLLLIGLALILLDIKRPRMANFLPALVIAPLIVAVTTALGIAVYPLPPTP